MPWLVFPVNALAIGNITGSNTFTVNSLPLVDALTTLTGGPFPDGATIEFFVDDGAVHYDDLENGPHILTGEAFTTARVSLAGNKDYDFVVRPENPNEGVIDIDNQYNGELATFNGQYFISSYPDTTPVIGTFGGNIVLGSMDGGFPDSGSITYTPDPTGAPYRFYLDAEVVCFTTGTLIETPDGPRAVETLKVGDLVTTMDSGPQPIRWISSRSIRPILRHDLLPVLIPAGALGAGCPESDLRVSPQHRVALNSPAICASFDTDAVLIAAKKLVGHNGIRQESQGKVVYVHFLLDRHELVWANGTLTETLLTGQMALRALGAAQLREIALIFPEIAQPTHVPHPARRILGRGEFQRILKHFPNDRLVGNHSDRLLSH
ncbi:Hint domain-containing protein [Paracoccus sp. NGMCC 1.201697]|uniref:Hint domain-containing protein n=1 Tax=Paracoccus broussonetiae subsp. drimophilus TaxID=3373869 RepID=A0ABW7LTD2_9RHOB